MASELTYRPLEARGSLSARAPRFLASQQRAPSAKAKVKAHDSSASFCSLSFFFFFFFCAAESALGGVARARR